jgi:DNA-directed RNA polymerase specialized sigma24 family protein
MANRSATIDYTTAPESYDELFRNYYSFVVGLVGKQGIAPDNREDVASEILLRFYERDFLNEFNPDLSFEVNGKVVKARFKSFLSAFVVNYVRSHRDRQNLRAKREPLTIDGGYVEAISDIGDSGVTPLPKAVAGETFFYEDDYSGLYEKELVSYLRDYLSKVPRKSRQDQCDLVRLFDAVVCQARTNGKYSVKELQRIFNVSPTAIHSWLGWLRQNITLALEDRSV